MLCRGCSAFYGANPSQKEDFPLENSEDSCQFLISFTSISVLFLFSPWITILFLIFCLSSFSDSVSLNIDKVLWAIAFGNVSFFEDLMSNVRTNYPLVDLVISVVFSFISLGLTQVLNVCRLISHCDVKSLCFEGAFLLLKNSHNVAEFLRTQIFAQRLRCSIPLHSFIILLLNRMVIVIISGMFDEVRIINLDVSATLPQFFEWVQIGIDAQAWERNNWHKCGTSHAFLTCFASGVWWIAHSIERF